MSFSRKKKKPKVIRNSEKDLKIRAFRTLEEINDGITSLKKIYDSDAIKTGRNEINTSGYKIRNYEENITIK